MKNKRKIYALYALFSALVSIVLLCVLLGTQREKKENPQKALPPEKPQTVTLCAVGDNLIHSPIYKKCKTADGYNFDCLYENIAPYIKKHDIAAINQETIFVQGEENFSGYPLFGTPKEVGESIVRAGFNVVTHATNHTYDKGKNALFYTMDFWDNYPCVSVLGLNKSEEAARKTEILNINGIKTALLNYTYGLNGHRLPRGEEYLINIFKRDEKTAAHIKNAKAAADICIVFIHYGTEYTHNPTKEQKADVEFLCENGADIIIGAHPHVIQPVTAYTSENQNKAVVFWSLGNFISNQDSTEKILGGMADITIEKKNGNAYVKSYKMLPTVTHADSGGYSAYLLSDYTDALAASHRRVPNLTVEKLNDLFCRVMAVTP